jgi:hypothetical protein
MGMKIFQSLIFNSAYKDSSECMLAALATLIRNGQKFYPRIISV